MKLVEQHIIKKGNPLYDAFDSLTHLSKNLFNAGLYAVRQNFFECQKNPSSDKQKYLNYNAVDKLFKETHNVDYYAMPIDASQQTLRILDKTFKAFFELLKKKNRGEYEQKVRIPNYLPKDGHFVFQMNYVKLGKKCRTEGLCRIPNTDITFRIINYATCKQVRIVPKNGYFVLENVYEVEEKPLKEKKNRYMSLDPGVNNFMTVTSNVIEPFIIDGKWLKHINQYYNKRTSELKSELEDGVYTSKRIEKITNDRNLRIKWFMHTASAYLVNQAVSADIDTIVVGHNDGQKQEINIGGANNQNMVCIPFDKFIDMLTYKARLQGIEVVRQEESYSSQASFFDGDFVPTYKEGDDTVYTFSGKRIKRGMYKTKDGFKFNADVNGALNILVKYLQNKKVTLIGLFDLEVMKGWVVTPRRVLGLKTCCVNGHNKLEKRKVFKMKI